MSNCKINYIENTYREKSPQLANRLTEVFHAIWKDLKDSELFRPYGDVHLLSKAKTKQRIKQEEFLQKINAKYNTTNNKPLVSAKLTSTGLNEKVVVNIHPIAEQESIDLGIVVAEAVIIPKVNPSFDTKEYLDDEGNSNTNVMYSLSSNSTIKPGVEELFESNPELANTVYEALGFEIPTTKLKGKKFYYGEPTFFDIATELTSGERSKLPSSILINKLLHGEFLPTIKDSQIILGLSEAGIWRPNLKKIEASGENKSTLAKKVGHELLHSVTNNIILSYQNLKGVIDFNDKYYKDFIKQGYVKPTELTKSQIEALDNLVRIRNKVVAYIEQNKDKIQKQDRGFGTYDYFIRTNYTESETDLHEFISEVFTNPELINILKEIPTEGKKSNLFKDFVDAIAKILGFTNTSILEDIIAYSEEAFFAQPQITPQQKQQAQQLYSQYLDAIGVTNIAYHHSEEDISEFTSSSERYFQKELKKKNKYISKLDDIVFLVKKPLTEEFMSNRKFIGSWGLKTPKILQFNAGEKIGEGVHPGIDEGIFAGINGKYDAIDFGRIRDNKTWSEVIAITNPKNAVKLGSKQDIEGFKKFTNSNTMPQLSSLESPKADLITMSKIKSLLTSIGFTPEMVQTVDNITLDGVKIEANGIAIIADKVIQIAQGKENIALPEEAMHFVVELLKVNKPSLYNELIKDITSYKIYKDLINNEEYKQAYRKPNGTLDIQKMKDEAIAKVLVEYIINKSDPRIVDEAKVEKLQSLWVRILNYLRDIFRNKENPFRDLAIQILNEDTSDLGTINDLSDNTAFYFSLSMEDRNAKYQDNKKILDSLRNRVKELNIEKRDEQYYMNGTPHKSRVSDIVEKYYVKKFGAKKTWTDDKQKEYDLSREHGTLIHSIIESTINMYVDKETGLVRDTILSIPEYITSSTLNKYMFEELAPQVITRLSKFPEGTRFAAEEIIFNTNTNMMGTVDLIAIDPEGEISVFDWKSIIFEEYSKNYGLKDFKREAFDIQMKEYKNILQTYPNINNFGYMRMIPISKMYDKDKNGKVVLKSISAQINADKETAEYLKPFISSAESTGNTRLDKFINSLTKQIEEVKIRYKNLDFEKMSNLVTYLHKVIYDIRTGDESLLDLSNINAYISLQMSDAQNILRNINDKEKLDNKELNNILKELRFIRSSLDYLKDSNILFKLIENDTFNALTEEVQELRNLLFKSEEIVEELEEKEKNLLDNLAKASNIQGLLNPELTMNMWNKLARSTSQGQTAAIQTLYRLTDFTYQKATFDLDSRFRKLEELKYNVDQEAQKLGVTTESLFDKLFKKDKDGKFSGNFISEVDSAFFKEREIIQKSSDIDLKKTWFMKNYKLQEYKNWFQKERDSYIQKIAENTYSENEKFDLKLKKEIIEKFDQKYDVTKYPETALTQSNTRLWNNYIRFESWPSKEYEEIKKYPALLESFNYFRSINKELKDTGLLKDQNSYTFIPNVRRGLAESLMMSDKNLKRLLPFSNFLNDISAKDDSMYYGKVDVRTGQKVDELNIRFISDNFKKDYKEKSKDLFSSYYLMSQELAQYNHLSQVDEIAQALLHLEKGKVSLDKQGNFINDNSENAKVLETHIKALVYRQGLQTKEGAYFSYNYNKFVEKWNNSFAGSIKKLKPVENGEVSISGTKLIMKLNNMNSVRVLSGNISSAIANIFGGTASTYLLGRRYFSYQDITDAMKRMESSAWYATEDMKKRAALVDYFLPLLDEQKNIKGSQLSIAKASTLLSGEWMMALQRKGDDFVQLNIFLAMLENFTVQDGKLVSIKKMMEDKNGFDQMFNLKSRAEREALQNKINKDIKEFREKNSLVNQAKVVTKKVNGKDETFIELPGIERGSEQVMELRRLTQTIVKDAIGNVSDTDLSPYKANMLLRLFMSFKNWIPRTADVRFGEFRYDSGHDAWEYGRYRMMIKSLGGNVLMSLGKLLPLIGRGISKFEGQDYLIEKAKEVYLAKKQEVMEKGLYNEKTFPKEAEFVKSYIDGVNSTFAEMRTFALLFLLLASAIMAPDDDDDDETKNAKRKTMRLVDKMSDELSFFYNANSFLDIMGSKPLPVISMITDVEKLTVNILQEFGGVVLQNEEWIDSAKPSKTFFKMFPISKEIVGYIPIIDPELGKEMGIEITQKNKN